jgi:hypothetical protein
MAGIALFKYKSSTTVVHGYNFSVNSGVGEIPPYKVL